MRLLIASIGAVAALAAGPALAQSPGFADARIDGMATEIAQAARAAERLPAEDQARIRMAVENRIQGLLIMSALPPLAVKQALEKTFVFCPRARAEARQRFCPESTGAYDALDNILIVVAGLSIQPAATGSNGDGLMGPPPAPRQGGAGGGVDYDAKL